jgi:WD40 repeat protein
MSTWRFAKGHLHNLTEDTINKTHVSLSQDGQLLAYVSNRGGNSNIWLESTKDQTLEKLTNQSSDFYTALAFSPDNRYFAYVKTNLDASTELTVLDLNNHRKEAFHMQNVGYASWSKHEQGMLYIYQTSDGGNIFKLNMASRTLSHKLPVAELRRFEVMPSGHIITQEKLNNDLTILPDPSLAKSNAQASSINIDIYTNEPWVVVGDKVSVLRQNLNQRAKIHFYDIEGKHNEMDSITLQSDSPIIFYTLSNSKEIIYYSTIDSTKHVMYKFSPLNQ